MKYTKQNFYTGQKLKASHLDHIEDGIVACDVGLRVGEEAGAFSQDSFLAQIDGQDIQITGALATGIGSIAFGGQSYGSNIFNPQWLIDYVDEYYKNNIEPYGNGLKISSYPCKTSITFAKFLELTGLKIGDTFTSVSKIIDAETGEQLISGTYNITFEHAGDGTWLDITSANVKYPKKITITEDMLKYQQLNIYMQNAKTTPRYVLDMVITKTDTLVPYEPYSADPIDIITIPQEIQTSNGYGKDGFVLDFENKSTEYEDTVTPVSEHLTGYDKFKTLKVQGGGKIRFVSADKIPVPSEITYIKAKEV